MRRKLYPSRPSIAWKAALATGALGLLPHATSLAAPWDAYLKGTFDPVVPWSLIPIHAALLPDGRVMTYGSNQKGEQGAQLVYDVWNPAKGTGEDAHLVLPNATTTDIFCSGQILLPGSGRLLLAGGDRTVLGVRNFAVRDVNFYDYRNDGLYAAEQPMHHLRWYGSVLTLASGEILAMGGSSDPGFYSHTPEIYKEGQGWRILSNAASDEAYGIQNWNYPRGWLAPNGKVFIITRSGSTFYLDPAGKGGIERLNVYLPEGDSYLPSVMFAPGKIFALRKGNKAVVVDITGFTPKVTAVTGPGQDRYHASLTMLPDGKVLLTGGSARANVAEGVAYAARIWNPASNGWTTGASAVKMRLYHSTALLLPDGRVLTAGGGAPGPVANLNAEIFSPPYLYKQDLLLLPSRLATRPAIVSLPATATWGESLPVQIDAGSIRRVTLVKSGSVTHTADFDQRFLELKFTASGSKLDVTMPASAGLAPPGYYMLFVINSANVPSVGRIVKLGG